MTTILFHKGKMVADGKSMANPKNGSPIVTGTKVRKLRMINGKLYGGAGSVDEIKAFLSAIKAGKPPTNLSNSTILEWDGKHLYKWTERIGWCWPKKDWWFPLDFITNQKRIGGYNTIAAIGSGQDFAKEFYKQGKGNMVEAIEYAAEMDPSTNKFVRAATLAQEWIANNPYIGWDESLELQTIFSWTATTDASSYADNRIWIHLKQDGTAINTWIHFDQHSNTGNT